MTKPLLSALNLAPARQGQTAKQAIEAMVGDVNRVKTQFLDLQRRVQADEIMLTNYIFDEAKQLHAYRLFKQLIDTL